MGNTIRRQPVNFNIPGAPNYKFLNVVDFRGIDVSDNPFVVKQNTASDALNVYVDESNALTTRPRINLEYSLGVVNRDDFVETLFVYKLNTRTVFQCKMINSVKIYIKHDGDDAVVEITGDVVFTSEKYSVFEDGEKIYMANNDGYFVIKSDNKAYSVVNDVDTYVPITHTGSISTGKDVLTPNEDDNKLSHKYRVGYFWDLESDYTNVLVEGGELVENNYVDYKILSDASNIFDVGVNVKDDFVIATSEPTEIFLHRIEGFNEKPFEPLKELTQLPFIFNGGAVYKGVSDLTEAFIGCTVEFTIPGSLDLHQIYVLHVEKNPTDSFGRNTIYFTENKSVSDSKINQKKYFDARDILTNTEVFGSFYNNKTGLKFNTTLRVYNPLNDLPLEDRKGFSDVDLFSYNPVGNMFLVGSEKALCLLMGEKNQRQIFIIDTADKSYVFKGVPRKQLYVNDDGSIVIAAMLNKTESLDSSDWQLVAFRKNGTTYDEVVLYKNTDTALSYRFLEVFVSDDFFNVCFFNTNTKEVTNNNFVFLKDIKEDGSHSKITFTHKNFPSLSDYTKRTTMFTKDLSRMVSVDKATNVVYVNDFDFTKNQFTEKIKKIPVQIYVWALSDDGKAVGVAPSATTGPDGNTQWSKLYKWFIDTDKFIFLADTAKQLDEMEINPNILGITSDLKSMYGFGFVYDDVLDVTTNKIYLSSLVPSTNPLLIVEYPKKDVLLYEPTKFNGFMRFDNNYFFYGADNKLYITENNNPTYITRTLQLGKTEDPITDMLLIAYDTAMAFKEDSVFIIQPYSTEVSYGYRGIEAKSTIGAHSPQASIISPLTETPLYVGLTGIYAIQSLKNVQSTDKISVLYSENITNLTRNGDLLFMNDLKHKNIMSTKRLYWTLFIAPQENSSNIYVLDDRTASWFVWNIPIKTTGCWVFKDVVYVSDSVGNVYSFVTTDIINKHNPNVTEYYDAGDKIINWYWNSQILPMGTINYSKKLIDTTFVLSDTDSMDEYGLNYKYKIFRKSASETKETTIQNDINYVQSTTKRTLIPRFNFIQLELSNIQDDINNNKLRLIGLGLKYVLLEGLY